MMVQSTAIFKRLEANLPRDNSNADYPVYYGFAPGRLNIIGEHIDYCGGFVMPAAITLGTYMVARRNDTGRFRLSSENFPGEQSFASHETACDASDGWIKYVKGTLHLLRAEFPKLPDFGLDITLYGTLPLASGLSSSASILTGILEICRTVFGIRFSDNETADARASAIFARRVENDYIGLQSGIMDQASIIFAKKDTLMLMDCANVSVEYVPYQTDDFELIIADTCKPRSLITSKYNERKAETDEALRQLTAAFPISHLCDIGPETRNQALSLLRDPVIQRRTKHVIDENQRVLLAKNALENHDMATFARCLTESHRSLRENYEVTGKELDAMVEAALRQPEVAGARMTGAGFSGSALIFARAGSAGRILPLIAQEYEQATGLTPAFYPFVPNDGVTVTTHIF